jgi:hypothetical protein
MKDNTALGRMLIREGDIFAFIPVAAVVAAGTLLVDLGTLLATLATLCISVIPGFLVARRFLRTVPAVLYGFPLGYTLTSLVLILVVAVHGWSFIFIGIAYVTTVAILFWLLRGRRPIAAGETADTPSLPLIVALTTAFAVALLYFPLVRAGALTLNGYAYTGLFGHDFILRGVDSVALANDVPSENYFFNGVKTYNYYILWYMLPATVYNLLGQRAPITGIISLLDLTNVAIFGPLLYYALERFMRATLAEAVHATRLAVIFFLLFLLSYSYHWLFFAVTQFFNPLTVPALAHASEQMGQVSTSWLKDFLFQPHCVLALMQFLVVVRLAIEPRPRSWALWAGLLLGSILLTDVVLFLVLGSAFGIWYLLRGSLRHRFLELVLLIGSALGVIALAFALRVFAVPEYSNRIVLSPYVTAIIGLPALLLLCLGPLVVCGILVLRIPKRFASEEARLLLILLVVSLFFMLFVTEVVEGNVFLRKSLMALRLPFFIFASAYLYAFLNARRPQLMLVLLIGLGVPTLLTDLYATSQTTDSRYTMYIAPDEMKAARWLRSNTRPDSVVQSLIEYHGGIFDYSLPICFGDRRAALGLWQMAFQRYPNRDAITRRVHQVQALFSTESNEERASLTKDLHIDYVVIGPRERARFPGVDSRFLADTLHFTPEHVAQTVTVFRVRVDADAT